MKERRLVKKAVYHMTVFVIGIIMIYPLIQMVMSSFKENSIILPTAGSLIPENFIFSNYSTGWKGFGKISFATFFQNSIFTSVVATPGTVVSSVLMTYGFARFKLRGRGILFAAMLFSMMLPAQVPMISQYLRCQKLGWVGFYMPSTISYFFVIQGFFVYLISNLISGIPTELDETVGTDGCSYARTFTCITLSLIKPVPIAACIFSFMWRWDNFLPALLYVSESSTYPVNLAFKLFCDPGSSSDYGAMFAMATLSILSSTLIFLFSRKYLVEGISTFDLKG